MKLRGAEIVPLQGKYYGTEICIVLQDSKNNDVKEVVNLWLESGGAPSIRELTKRGYTQDEWDTNAKVGLLRVRDDDCLYGTHLETRDTYNIALSIVEAINNYVEKDSTNG